MSTPTGGSDVRLSVPARMPRCRHLILPPGGAPSSLVERFEIAYADDHGEQRVPLTEAWAVPFEACTPVRGFPSYKGQRHHNGQHGGLRVLA